METLIIDEVVRLSACEEPPLPGFDSSDEHKANTQSALLKTLANHNRLKILLCLQRGDKTLGQLANMLGVTSAGALHSVAVLLRQNLVLKRAQGRQTYYKTNVPEFELFWSAVKSASAPNYRSPSTPATWPRW